MVVDTHSTTLHVFTQLLDSLKQKKWGGFDEKLKELEYPEGIARLASANIGPFSLFVVFSMIENCVPLDESRREEFFIFYRVREREKKSRETERYL